MEVARSKNSTPLPSVKPHCGIRLPPDCHCLAACNYRLKTIKKTLPKSTMAHSGGSTTGPRITSMLGGARAVHRPSSPAVRVTTVSATTPNAPRPVVKINAGINSAATNVTPTPAPKIQISVAPQTNPSVENIETDSQTRGIKRERVDDDYDAL